jgi:hypothetical protein
MIEKKPFVKYNLDDSDTNCITFTIRLNKEEQEKLKQMKKLIQQEKDSTCIKQFAFYGFDVLQDKKTLLSLELLYNNLRKNKRLGIQEVE